LQVFATLAIAAKVSIAIKKVLNYHFGQNLKKSLALIIAFFQVQQKSLAF
jgi:hypothetical protein